MRRRPLNIAALFLPATAIFHASGTPAAVRAVNETMMEPGFKRALGVLWVNGAVLPLVLAGVLAHAAAHQLPGLVKMVIVVTLVQAGGAAYVAGIGFPGVWMIVAAAGLMIFGLYGGRPRSGQGSP